MAFNRNIVFNIAITYDDYTNMTKDKEVLRELHEKHIIGTQPKKKVADKTVFLCHMTNAVCDAIGIESQNGEIYVTTRSLKHLYDKKPAEEYDFVVDNLHTILKYPDHIYENKGSKRGDFVFRKELKGGHYLGMIEIDKDNGVNVFAVTAFRLRKKSYIEKYPHLWSWEGGNPPS